MSEVEWSLLTRAEEASNALFITVQNNDVYPGDAENWLYTKLFERSVKTVWIQMYLLEATEVSRKIVEFDQNAVGIKFVQLKTTSFTNLECWFPQNTAAATEKPPGA